MKPLKHILILVITLTTITINAQDRLNLNPKQSQLSWTGKAAFNAYSLTGSLEAKEGQVTVKDNYIIDLNITIDMKSLDHDNSDLKKHLRSKDFFEVKTYKTATFVLTQPAIIENNKAVLIGNMTIKNSTKQETIEVTIDGTSLSFNHTMDRTKYGVKFNSPSVYKKMKENAIADDFLLEGTLKFE